jgi:hypothetical protein
VVVGGPEVVEGLHPARKRIDAHGIDHRIGVRIANIENIGKSFLI